MNDIETKLNKLRVSPPSNEYESKGLNLIVNTRPDHPRQFIGWAMAASLLISIAANVYLLGQVRNQGQDFKPSPEPSIHTPELVQFISIPGVKDTPQIIVMESNL